MEEIIKAIEVLKKFCKEHKSCTGDILTIVVNDGDICPFYDFKDGKCLLRDTDPEKWQEV